MVKKEVKEFLSKSKYINKPIHLGGSVVYDMYPEIQKRIGMKIYEGSKSLKGKIIKTVRFSGSFFFLKE